MQVDPIEPMGEPPSNFAFKLNLRRYNPVETIYLASFEFNRAYSILTDELYHLRDAIEAGPYTRPLFGST